MTTPSGPSSTRASHAVHSVRDRQTFENLRRRGRRVRHDVLAVTYLGVDADGPPQVAFSLRRGVGTAVQRNKVRRRLRAIVREMTARQPSALRGTAVLITVSPDATTRSSGALKASFERCMQLVKRDVAI